MLAGAVTTSASRLSASTARRTVACRAPRDADVARAIRLGGHRRSVPGSSSYGHGRGRRHVTPRVVLLIVPALSITREGDRIGAPRQGVSTHDYSFCQPGAKATEAPRVETRCFRTPAFVGRRGRVEDDATALLWCRRLEGEAGVGAVVFLGVPVSAIVTFRVSALSAFVPNGVANTLISDGGGRQRRRRDDERGAPIGAGHDVDVRQSSRLTRRGSGAAPKSVVLSHWSSSIVTTDWAVPLCAQPVGRGAHRQLLRRPTWSDQPGRFLLVHRARGQAASQQQHRAHTHTFQPS